MDQQFIFAKNIEIYTENFGNPQHERILLVMGACSPGLGWGDYFCQKLVDANFYVTRFDHRDTGLSSCVDFSQQPYNLFDLMQDAYAVLTARKNAFAHIIGTSMGGYIAQLLALNHPEQVKSLTLISSSPDLSILIDPYAKKTGKIHNSSTLPLPHDEVINMLSQDAEHSSPEPVDQLAAQIHSWKILNGSKAPFDTEMFLKAAQARAAHTKNPTAAENHLRAIANTDFNIIDKLAQITAPTLIMHGNEDPILPLAHGQALASAMPKAKLKIIDNMGHLLEPFYDEILVILRDFLLALKTQ
jgi:pimeloyl-ACP methyl ester carboxylesterase